MPQKDVRLRGIKDLMKIEINTPEGMSLTLRRGMWVKSGEMYAHRNVTIGVSIYRISPKLSVIPLGIHTLYASKFLLELSQTWEVVPTPDFYTDEKFVDAPIEFPKKLG